MCSEKKNLVKMVKCIAVRCKSRYKSCSQKKNFFIVPKDKKKIKDYDADAKRTKAEKKKAAKHVES